MKDGNILVSAATSPSIMPAMKKAAAFVTDEGGLTSHAAIVARELNTPCVFGTKIATKVLNDCDLIEVDATNGIIKKL
jgi:pyruvate,water dikinase